MPTQMPRNGVPRLVAVSIAWCMPVTAAEAARAVREGALARQHDPVGASDEVGIGGHAHLGVEARRSAASASAREAEVRLPLP